MSQSGKHWQEYEREQRARIARKKGPQPKSRCLGCGAPLTRGKRCASCSAGHSERKHVTDRRRRRQERRELAEQSRS